MKKTCLVAYIILSITTSCSHDDGEDWYFPKPVVIDTTVVVPEEMDESFVGVAFNQTDEDKLMPMTGLVLWPEKAKELDPEYRNCITMEYSYCKPSDVVIGKEGNEIIYDWTTFEHLLDDIASRGHQAIIRFRYEYPANVDVDGVKGSTAVPAYIKALPDYHETYNKNAGGDGPTYYADWSNTELQWFTKQFYTDFAQRYNNDNRIAFLEVGFGHWSEYHIYGTRLQLGHNFPSREYQACFLTHLGHTLNIPWLISIDAADDEYSPIIGDNSLMDLNFGLFDDSFMHQDHEIGTADGYNEQNWNLLGDGCRWTKAACGGEISYYDDGDQLNFLNPLGMHGTTFENAVTKYHITFMIANDAPDGIYGTPERFREASAACGYRFKIIECRSNGTISYVLVKNIGVAPIYRNAYIKIGSALSDESLKGLLPDQGKWYKIDTNVRNTDTISIIYNPLQQTD